MDSSFVRSLLRDTVLVKPHMLGSNYREVVLQQLRMRFEGLCSRHGYILPGTTVLHRIVSGRVEAVSLNGDVRYDVQYFASVCNPPVGTVLPARVVNMNKFGVLAHSGVQAEDGTFRPVVESIITRQPISGAAEVPNAPNRQELGEEDDDAVDLDSLAIGDMIFVEIVGKKFELNDEKISVIGRATSRPSPTAASSSAAVGVVGALGALSLSGTGVGTGMGMGMRGDAEGSDTEEHHHQEQQGDESEDETASSLGDGDGDGEDEEDEEDEEGTEVRGKKKRVGKAKKAKNAEADEEEEDDEDEEDEDEDEDDEEDEEDDIQVAEDDGKKAGNNSKGRAAAAAAGVAAAPAAASAKGGGAAAGGGAKGDSDS